MKEFKNPKTKLAYIKSKGALLSIQPQILKSSSSTLHHRHCKIHHSSKTQLQKPWNQSKCNNPTPNNTNTQVYNINYLCKKISSASAQWPFDPQGYHQQREHAVPHLHLKVTPQASPANSARKLRRRQPSPKYEVYMKHNTTKQKVQNTTQHNTPCMLSQVWEKQNESEIGRNKVRGRKWRGGFFKYKEKHRKREKGTRTNTKWKERLWGWFWLN